MGLKIDYFYGQSPLDEDEKEGLKVKSITTRGELDEFEQQNIEKAIEWIIGKKFSANYILSEEFVKELHKRMFGDVWDWAGKFRRTNKNIGVDKQKISIELRQLLDDCKYWIQNDVYSEDEIAVRFKYGMVKIHPFPNGNGRHSRLIADVLVEKVLKQPLFYWGSTNISRPGETRETYIKALHAADQGDFSLLLKFTRS